MSWTSELAVVEGGDLVTLVAIVTFGVVVVEVSVEVAVTLFAVLK